MKYLVVSTIALTTMSLAMLTVVPESTVVIAGDPVSLTVELADKDGNPLKGVVNIEPSVGGFEDPEIIIEGLEVDGVATVVYIAPNFETDARIVFTYGDESTSITLKVVKEEIEGEEVGVEVIEFGGNVAYRKRDSDVWESVEKGLVMKQGCEILTMSDSYVVLRFPNDSETRILQNTQVLIEKLLKVAEGSYVVRLVQKKGRTFNSIMRILKKGEKFEVKAGSVTAGVRGTKFAVEIADTGTKIHTFEGVVYAYYDTGLVVPVGAGHTAEPDGTLKPLEKKEEDFEKPKVEEKGEGKGEEKGEEPKVEAAVPSIDIGTVDKFGKKYLLYSFSTDFTIGPVYLDVGITAYSTSVGGELYYGLPSDEPSTNLIDAITINAIGLKFGENFIRYGKMGSYTLGMGYTVRGYTAPFSNAIDLTLGFGNAELFVHLPYELRKISSFEFAQSDGVFIGDLRLHIPLPVLGNSVLTLGGLYDTQPATPSTDSVIPVDRAIVVSFKKPLLSWLTMGVELSGMMGESAVALGAFGGAYGNFMGVNLTAGAYVGLNGFKPYLFDQYYAQYKYTGGVPGINASGSSMAGYLVGGEFGWSWASGKVYLYGSFGGSPTLDGELKASLPSFGAFQGLYILGYIHDPTPTEGVLDSDTTAWLKITYPIVGEDITGGIMFYWDPESSSWQQSIVVGGVEWR